MTDSARVTDAQGIMEALAGMEAWDNPVITTHQGQTIHVRRVRSFNQSSRHFCLIPKSGTTMSIHLDDISSVEPSA